LTALDASRADCQEEIYATRTECPLKRASGNRSPT
jgi:hypothetical protein